jgi:hypothetical protein
MRSIDDRRFSPEFTGPNLVLPMWSKVSTTPLPEIQSINIQFGGAIERSNESLLIGDCGLRNVAAFDTIPDRVEDKLKTWRCSTRNYVGAPEKPARSKGCKSLTVKK